jgi:cell division protein ZapE
MTLIDALYEHRVKLVISADAPPEQLYRSGHGAAEFERTVSRLQEMRSGEYLALEHRRGP